jgi:hypothetical protein
MEKVVAPLCVMGLEREIQPIWDQHCIHCHAGDKNPAKQDVPLNLLGDDRPITNAAYGSTSSPLMEYLEPSHYGVQLTPQEKERVACWIDLNVPFAGSWMELNYGDQLDHAIHSGLTPRYVYRDKMRQIYLYFEAKRLKSAERELEHLDKYLQHGDKDADTYHLRSYPRVTSNSHYRYRPEFSPSCAIDGERAADRYCSAFRPRNACGSSCWISANRSRWGTTGSQNSRSTARTGEGWFSNRCSQPAMTRA